MNDEALREMSELMRSQSNRSTQYPLFVVQVKVRRWVDSTMDWDERDRKDEYDITDLCEECDELGAAGSGIPEDCNECSSETFMHWVVSREISDRAGFYLTEKACREHIEINAYHYLQPQVYVIGAWRNPEMVTVMQAILKLTGEEIPSHYQ